MSAINVNTADTYSGTSSSSGQDNLPEGEFVGYDICAESESPAVCGPSETGEHRVANVTMCKILGIDNVLHLHTLLTLCRQIEHTAGGKQSAGQFSEVRIDSETDASPLLYPGHTAVPVCQTVEINHLEKPEDILYTCSDFHIRHRP